MRKLAMALMTTLALSLLIVGCDPPQNRHAKPAEDGTCDCGHEHGAEGHVDLPSATPEATQEIVTMKESNSPEVVVTDSNETTESEVPTPEIPEQSINEEIPIDESDPAENH